MAFYITMDKRLFFLAVKEGVLGVLEVYPNGDHNFYPLPEFIDEMKKDFGQTQYYRLLQKLEKRLPAFVTIVEEGEGEEE